jgi:hypothetical protein
VAGHLVIPKMLQEPLFANGVLHLTPMTYWVYGLLLMLKKNDLSLCPRFASKFVLLLCFRINGLEVFNKETRAILSTIKLSSY